MINKYKQLDFGIPHVHANPNGFRHFDKDKTEGCKTCSEPAVCRQCMHTQMFMFDAPYGPSTRNI